MELIRESQIEDEFTGFDENMIFTLTSGERFQQAHYKYRYHYAYRPRVKILRDGSRWYLEIDGMNESIEVIKLL